MTHENHWKQTNTGGHKMPALRHSSVRFTKLANLDVLLYSYLTLFEASRASRSARSTSGSDWGQGGRSGGQHGVGVD